MTVTTKKPTPLTEKEERELRDSFQEPTWAGARLARMLDDAREKIVELEAERDEYRTQTRALNAKVRTLNKIATIETDRRAERIDHPRVHLPIAFTCDMCPHGGFEEEIEEHEAYVCGHPGNDAASGGSPVITPNTRPQWCPMDAAATVKP